MHAIRFVITIAAFVLLLLPQFAEGRTWEVHPDGSGDAPTIQAAADSSSTGDTILLYPGVFTGPGNRDVEILHGVTIESIAGAENTIIDCELQGFGIWLDSGGAIVEWFEARGITFRNPRDARSPDHGRALNMNRVHVLVRDCVFEGGNPGGVAFTDGAAAESALWRCRFVDIPGAAVANAAPGLTILDCEFERCDTGVEADNPFFVKFDISRFIDCGTAISSNGTRVDAVGCTFSGNDRAVWVHHGVASVRNCLFEHSTTSAVSGSPFSNITIESCVFSDNPGRPYAGGGQVDIQNTLITRNGLPIGGAQDLTLRVERSEISESKGAGIYTWASDVQIDRSTIARNGGFSVVMDGSLTIMRSIVTGNAEGIYVEREFARVEDNVIANNRGGVRFDLAGGTLIGNTIVGNHMPGKVLIESNQGGQAASNNIIAFNTASQVFAARSGTVTVSACDIYENTVNEIGPYTDGGDNFSFDPRFCDRPAGDFTLEHTSPCLAANSPNDVLVGALGEGCKSVVTVGLELTPGTIALRSNGLITATVTGVDNLDRASLRLNGSVAPVEQRGKGKGRPLQFRVADLVATLGPGKARGMLTVTLVGNLESGEEIYGETTIRIAPGKGQGDGPWLAGDDAQHSLPTPGFASVTPNPFNPTTRIRAGVTRAGHVELVVYDIAGREVARLADGPHPAGWLDISWNADGLPSGVYLARLVTPDGTFTRKLVLLK